MFNAPTGRMEQRDGRGYLYDHAAEDVFSGQDYLPET